jgi:4,5-dihydroxyphthalate decarboxylase
MYKVTAIVWQRGMLRDEYGVTEDQMQWQTGTLEPSNQSRAERVAFDLPPNVQPIPADKNLSKMLADGEIDALFTSRQPSTYDNEEVLRLFPNYKEVEKDYFKRTKILPIMHLIVIKRALYDAHPWVATSLVKAFSQSLDIARKALEERSTVSVMLPWLGEHLQETKDALGNQYWIDGLHENRHIIDKFCQYSYDQGLARKRFQPEELFAPNTLQSHAI